MIKKTSVGSGVTLSRRGFLATSGSALGALVLSFTLPGALRDSHAAAGEEVPLNAYIRIAPDDSITIVVALVEMGQGSFTAMPMLIAEELEVTLDRVRVEQAPANEKIYGHPLYGLQITGGSASVQAAWAKLRNVGATARMMLTAAAAQQWGVPVDQCKAVNGTVVHAATGRILGYGALAHAASLLPVPTEVALKEASQFRLVGTPAHRTDTPSKVNGAAQFGIDVKVPGMKVAAIALAPVIGGTLADVDDGKALAVNGVRQVLRSRNAVAVVADHYGAARKGLLALAVRWNDGPAADFSSQQWGVQLAEALKGKGVVAVNEGKVEEASKTAARRHRVVYESPPLAHAAMEPLNCTIHVEKDRCQVWLGTQAPARVQRLVGEALAMPPERIVVHNFLLGGGFGRKLDADYVEAAVQLAKQVNFPLKVVFSREEDIQHDAYRPYFRDELDVSLDRDGMPVALSHRFAGSAVIARYAPAWLNKGLDTDAVHTAGSPYAIPNKMVEFVRHEPPSGLLTGNWRGVGPTHHGFTNESLIDELALLSKMDPVRYRERLLSKNPRALAVLKLAAQKSGWTGKAGTRGRGRGMAVIDAWESYAALVTDVVIDKEGAVRITRMVCAIDCGTAVNPDGVKAQIEGGIVFGLSAALYGTLTFERGRVVQSNFHDYQPLRMHEMPPIEIHLLNAGQAPGGVGEIGTAVAIPSVMNAITAATGKRFRTYPVPAHQLKA